MVDKYINFERLFGEAKSLVSRLRESERSADLVVERAENIRSKIDSLKQYHSEAEVLQQFYPERPVRSSRRAVLREVALKNKRLAELSAENADLREMLVDQQSALDHIMIKYREQTSELMEKTRLNEQFLQQLDDQNTKEHQEAMEKIGDMAAVMAEAAALDEDRELRLVRAVHQLHLENTGLRELLAVSRRFGTGADLFDRGNFEMNQAGDGSLAAAHRSGTFLVRSGSQSRSRAFPASIGSGSGSGSMDSSLTGPDSASAAAEQDVSATDHYASHFSSSTCIRRSKHALEPQLAPTSEAAATSEAVGLSSSSSEREPPERTDKQTTTDDLQLQTIGGTHAPVDAADAYCPHCSMPLLHAQDAIPSSASPSASAFEAILAQIEPVGTDIGIGTGNGAGTEVGLSTATADCEPPLHTLSNSTTPDFTAPLAASPPTDVVAAPQSSFPLTPDEDQPSSQVQAEEQHLGMPEQQMSAMDAAEALSASQRVTSDALPEPDAGPAAESSSSDEITSSSDIAASN